METQEHGRTQVSDCRCGVTKTQVTRTGEDGRVELVARLCASCDHAALAIVRGEA